MNKRKTHIYLLIVFLAVMILSCSKKETALRSKNYKSTMTLEGKKYSKLYLHIIDEEWERTYIEGQKEGEYDWSFSYSDSIYDRSMQMVLSVPTGDPEFIHSIGFYFLSNQNDTLKYGQFHVSPGNQHIKGVLCNSTLEKKSDLYGGSHDIQSDGFLFTENTISDLSLGAELTTFKLNLHDSIEYIKNVKHMKDRISENRDSHFMMVKLMGITPQLKSKNNLKIIYNLFSEENKGSYYGQKIRDYINLNYFKNMQLTNVQNREKEYIIQDNKKHNVIIFSASWCAPCHKLISQLKDIYRDLNEQIEFTYISIDEPDTMSEWEELMKKEEIPWRSLFASDKINEVRATYHFPAVPHVFLVYPNSELKILNLSLNSDRNLLYEL